MKPFLIPAPRIKALIFDLDGTLADTMPLHLKSWQEVGTHFNIPVTDQMINELAGTPTIEVIKILNHRYGWTADPDEVYQVKNDSYARLKAAAGATKPIDDVLEVAQHYKDLMPLLLEQEVQEQMQCLRLRI